MENLPESVKRALIKKWVEKVQAFWSKDRCALLKSATTTSNEKWLWFRTLLSRTVVDGQIQDHHIDGKLKKFILYLTVVFVIPHVDLILV